MKKIVACIILISVLFLCACGKEPYIKSKIDVTLFPYEMPASEPQWVTLYYPNDDNTKLLAFSVALSQTGSFYDSIMNALLLGTEEGYVSPFPKGVSLRSTMLKNDVLYIDLSWQFQKASKEKFFACVAVLANTFCALNEVSFINVTVEGAQLTAPNNPDKPIMLLSKHTGSISHLMQNYGESSSVLSSFYGTVYLNDTTNKFLLPKTVSVSLKNENYALALLSSLIKESPAIFPDGFLVNSAPKFSKNTLFVELTCAEKWEYNDSWLGKNAIVCTLNTLYPDLKNIQLNINDNQGNNKATIKEPCIDAYNSIRNASNVITPKSNGTGLMHTRMLVSNMPSKSNIEDFLNEYILNVTPEFKSDAKIVNSVNVFNDTVIIDLRASYFDYFFKKNLTQEEEYAIIYSLITTACTFTGAKKVQILQDSQKRSTLCGHIKIDNPLLTLSLDYLETI